MKKFKLYNMAQAEKDNAKAMKRQGEHTTPKTDTSTKTVSVKVPGEVYDRLNQIKDEQGFKSTFSCFLYSSHGQSAADKRAKIKGRCQANSR